LELLFGQGDNGEGFAFAGLAANDGDIALGQAKGFGEEFDQLVIGGAVDRRGLDGDFQGAVVDFEDFGAAGAGREQDVEGEAGWIFCDGKHGQVIFFNIFFVKVLTAFLKIPRTFILHFAELGCVLMSEQGLS
jgi:hypothetical protein